MGLSVRQEGSSSIGKPTKPLPTGKKFADEFAKTIVNKAENQASRNGHKEHQTGQIGRLTPAEPNHLSQLSDGFPDESKPWAAWLDGGASLCHREYLSLLNGDGQKTLPATKKSGSLFATSASQDTRLFAILSPDEECVSGSEGSISSTPTAGSRSFYSW
jgi:hypothetical protein